MSESLDFSDPVPAAPAAPAAPTPPAAPAFKSVPGQAPFPAALKLPGSFKGNSASPFARVNNLHSLGESLLGVGRGEAHARAQLGYFFLSTELGNAHGMFFASAHTRYPKQPRFDWEARPDVGKGVYFGWLNEKAVADLANPEVDLDGLE